MLIRWSEFQQKGCWISNVDDTHIEISLPEQFYGSHVGMFTCHNPEGLSFVSLLWQQTPPIKLSSIMLVNILLSKGFSAKQVYQKHHETKIPK